MKRYVIMVLRRQGEEVDPVMEICCTEERAIRTSISIFRSGVQKVILVDESINVVFKDTRICKCGNVQREMLGEFAGEICYRDVCMDCKQVIKYDDVLKDESLVEVMK